MIKVEMKYKQGCILYYEMQADGAVYEGGITAEYEFFVSQYCPYKELMLRAIINACMDTDLKGFSAKDEWGLPLESFGFKNENGRFKADSGDLVLYDGCRKGEKSNG